MNKRNQLIYDMRSGGATYKEIGKTVGLSVARCRQIYLKMKSREKGMRESGFPVDMDTNIYHRLQNNGINNIQQLIEFVENGGDVTKFRKIGRRYSETIDRLIKDYRNT